MSYYFLCSFIFLFFSFCDNQNVPNRPNSTDTKNTDIEESDEKSLGIDTKEINKEVIDTKETDTNKKDKKGSDIKSKKSFPQNFNDHINKYEIAKLDRSKKVKLITTISGNPPHLYHILNLFFAYKFITSKGYTVEKIYLMPDSRYYVGGYKKYNRTVFTEKERIELANALVKILGQKVDAKDFFDKLKISDFVINYSKSKNKFIDYPYIFKEFSKQNKTYDIVYVGGENVALSNNFISMKRNESIYNMSSTAIMDKNHEFHIQAVNELEYYAPGYYKIIEDKIKKTT